MTLSDLGYDEYSSSPFTRNANGSYTLIIPSGGGKTYSKVHPLISGLMCLDGQTVTGLASGTPANATEAYAHEFALTISTLLTCDVPLPASCQANDDELYVTQWEAFRVSRNCFIGKIMVVIIKATVFFEAHPYNIRWMNGGLRMCQIIHQRAPNPRCSHT